MKATDLKLNQTFSIENNILMPIVKTYLVVQKTPISTIAVLQSAYIRTLGQPIQLNVENLSKTIILEPNEIVKPLN